MAYTPTTDDQPTDDDMQEQFVAGAMVTGFAYSRAEAREDWAAWLAAHDAAVRGLALTAQAQEASRETQEAPGGPRVPNSLEALESLPLGQRAWAVDAEDVAWIVTRTQRGVQGMNGDGDLVTFVAEAQGWGIHDWRLLP